MGGRELGRRDVLVIGASLLGSGCAILRGGARHPVYTPSAATRDGSVLRLPLAELASLRAQDVLEVRPGKPFPDLLVARFGEAGAQESWRVVTADCPHAGCTVELAEDARGWSCPCHGSAFALDGALLRGPAEAPLGAPVTRVEGDVLVIELGSTA